MPDNQLIRQVDWAVRSIIPRLIDSGWHRVHQSEHGLGQWRHRGQQMTHSIERQESDLWAHVTLSRGGETPPPALQVQKVWHLCYPQLTGIVIIPPLVTPVDDTEVVHVWTNLSKPTLVPPSLMNRRWQP